MSVGMCRRQSGSDCRGRFADASVVQKPAFGLAFYWRMLPAAPNALAHPLGKRFAWHEVYWPTSAVSKQGGL
jgi:hypothetical protein